jgi:glycogenin glucosyltransferase
VWTLITDGDEYAISALKLIKSIRIHTKIGFDANLLELTTKPIRSDLRTRLLEAGWRICLVDRIAPFDENATFPRFRDQFTKLQLWRMIEYESVVYLDSDCFIVENIDHLFKVHLQLNDVHKIGVSSDFFMDSFQTWFNMGVFVLKPNETEYARLVELNEGGSVRFMTVWSEQGFLNEVYKDRWFEIGFEYNANLAVYGFMRKYWDERERDIRVIHYTMSKPWNCTMTEFKPVCDIWLEFD